MKIIISGSAGPVTVKLYFLDKLAYKFTPTPYQCNNLELSKDIKEYTRKLRLAEYFHSESTEEETIETPDLVKNKSNFYPPKGRNTVLDSVCDALENIPLSGNTERKNKSNITKEEINAMKKLSTDCSIVIKEADKGGAVVIMDAEFYKNKVMSMLTDEEFYKEISENQDKKTMQKVKYLIQKHSDTTSFTKKEKDFLTDFDFRESVFYGLPKIHKSKIITEAIKEQNSDYVTCHNPQDLTLRPIVGGPQSPTQRLSHLLDILLKPLCPVVKSFVRDDLDFLRYLPTNVLPDDRLITMDVTNLYTNITCNLGFKALEYWINKHPEKIDSRFTKEFILEATEIVLKNNTFNFDSKHYAQIKGTAMGTKMAPTYATLTLGYLEEILYSKINEQFNSTTADNIKTTWKRFLDDCFIIWKDTNLPLETFCTLLNDLDPDINFTMEESQHKISFLDILITHQGEKLSTDIFYKPTDTHQYLHFASCHPRHTL